MRAKKIVRGRALAEWDSVHDVLTTSYEHHDFRRSCQLSHCAEHSPPLYANNGRLYYEIALDPGQHWQAHSTIHMIGDQLSDDVGSFDR